MPYLSLRPSQVILDPENPRLPDGTSSDREAINRLLEDGAEALVSLARDLARTGQTNPAELPIAVKDGSKYLVLEGNRRFAALKLLADPALVDDEAHQKAFRRAAALGKPPKTVYTLVAGSREEADHWIVLRHTGENNGTGVKRWSASQTATHRRRANKTVDSGTLRSMTIADELEEAYASDTEITELVRKVRREKLTNIGRFFSKDVMTRLHFELKTDNENTLRAQTLMVRHTSIQLRDFFAWALTYIANNSVDAYKNPEVRDAAIQKHAKHLLPNPAKAADEPFRLTESLSASSGEPREVSQNERREFDTANSRDSGAERSWDANDTNQRGSIGNTGQQDSNATDNDDGKTQRKNEARPERFLLQGLRLPNHPERVQRLLKECRSLSLEDSPGTACVMLRVIVELSVSSQEALALSGEDERSQLRRKILAMLKYLDPNIENPARRDKTLAQAYLEADNLGVQYLNGFVHNPTLSPDQHLQRLNGQD